MVTTYLESHRLLAIRALLLSAWCCLTAVLAQPALAESKFGVLVFTADIPKAEYQGLILSGDKTYSVYNSSGKSATAKIVPTGETPRIRNWKTVYFDGAAVKVEGSLCLMLGKDVCRVAVENSKAKFAFAGNQFPFTYSIDRLRARPLQRPGQPFTLIGQSELAQAISELKDHKGDIVNLRQTASTYGAGTKDPTSEDLKVELLTICDNYLGIEKLVHQDNLGATHPTYGIDWGTYKLSGHDLKRIELNQIPKSIQARAAERLKKVDSTTIDLFPDPDWEHFLLKPKGSDFEIDFGVTTTDPAVHGLLLPISAACSGLYPADYAHLNSAFLSSHPQMKDLFFAPAPDQSAVVFIDKGQLFFKDCASGKTQQLLANVGSFRGWQWVLLQSVDNQFASVH
jgi:hypothetical protein